jgi:hypothetical protein
MSRVRVMSAEALNGGLIGPSIARSAATLLLAALFALSGSWSRSQSLDERPDPTVKANLPGCRAILRHRWPCRDSGG